MTVTITSSLRVALVSGSGVTFDAPVVNLISTDDVYSPTNPAETLTDLLSAISSAKLAGSATVDGTTVGNTSIFTVATGEKFIPTSVVFALTAVAGSGQGPVINAGFTANDYVDYIDSTRSTDYTLDGGAIFAAGSGYSIGDTLTLSGGTVVTSDFATIDVTSASVVALNVNAPGTIYAPGDTITLAGGVPVDRGVITVVTVKLVSATINAGGTLYDAGNSLATAAINSQGSGYDDGMNPSTFDVTVNGGSAVTAATVNVTSDGSGNVSVNSISLVGSYQTLPTLTGNLVTGDDGTNHGSGLSLDLTFDSNPSTFDVTVIGGTGTASVVNVTTDGFGVVDTINLITTPGSYTALPSLTANAVTGDDGSHAGTGLTLDLVYGINTISITTNGEYTTETASFTQFSTTSVSGTGATFNGALYGVVGYSISNPGTYIVVPSNHIATTGGGSGANFDATWETTEGPFFTIDTVGQLVQVVDFFAAAGDDGADYVYMTGGQELKIRVAFPATFSTYTMKAFVFGFTFS